MFDAGTVKGGLTDMIPKSCRLFGKDHAPAKRHDPEKLQTSRRDHSQNRTRGGSGQRLDCGAAAIARLRSEVLLDAQELVVFRSAVGTRERAGLDLPAIGGDSEVGDGGILGFP